jgi:hypothetical protein
LEVVNGAVAFNNSLRRKPRLLEVSVNIRREDKITMRLGAGDLQQLIEALVRRRFAIEVQPVPIKGPGQMRVLLEPSRVGHFLK